MSQNGQIHKIFKVCLTILGHYALKGINPFFPNIPFWSLWKYQKTKSFFLELRTKFQLQNQKIETGQYIRI